MQAKDFDFARFADYCARSEERVRDFLHQRSGLLLQERTYGPYTACRTPQESLEVQLEMMTRQMECSQAFVPYLEPWFGVGVFANAFGCDYVWIDGESPQTHYIVHDCEQAEQIGPAAIAESPVMKLVLEAIDYFITETDGRIPISCTDTQSPIDTATLIWDTSDFFTALYEEPELVHRVLGLITDATISFTEQQIAALGAHWARPGHIMLSAPGAPGFSISDDNIVMLSANTYAEFAVPSNERISRAFGGLAVHSCGNYERQLPALLETEGLMMVDGAFCNLQVDPGPNNDLAHFRDSMRGRGIILQARCGSDWPAVVAGLYAPDLPLTVPVAAEPGLGEHPRDHVRTLLRKAGHTEVHLIEPILDGIC